MTEHEAQSSPLADDVPDPATLRQLRIRKITTLGPMLYIWLVTVVMITCRDGVDSIFKAYGVYDWAGMVWLATMWVPAAQALLVRYKIKSKDDQTLVAGTTKTVRTYDLEQARDLLRGCLLMAGIQLTFFFLPTLLAAVMPGNWDADKAWKTTGVQLALNFLPFNFILYLQFPISQIHLFNAEPVGAYARPFWRPKVVPLSARWKAWRQRRAAAHNSPSIARAATTAGELFPPEKESVKLVNV
ncbi:uncharacterized protein LOC62_05G007096 [Vanrija pseudolonga]|uniref:Uncharacterized protein n=1 Tax=Vanrija pseudolonga TaxID=143232 RepID=A0AAF1BSJ5_9TREE|nr:hypothetical protein LOC62_05G007096 [Vanrija pseudolonga]